MQKITIIFEDGVGLGQVCENLQSLGKIRVVENSQTNEAVLDSFESGSGILAEHGNDNNLNKRISKIFMMIGIPPNIMGYQYLRESIKVCIKNPKLIKGITISIYPLVAKQFETTPSRVERAIRHAITVSWGKGKAESYNKLFGVKIYTANEKPSNGEVIALITDMLLIEGL